MDRRDFIRTLGVAGGAVLIGHSSGCSSPASVENRSAAPVPDPQLSGVCDIHIHCLPDTRPRCVDELTLAKQAKEAGYRALLYKSNDWSCHDRAFLIRQAVPDFEVFGSLCMNRVHGEKVNVYAAEQALKTSGGFAAVSGCRLYRRSGSTAAIGYPDREFPCWISAEMSCRKSSG